VPLNPDMQHTSTHNCATTELVLANRSVTFENTPHFLLFRLPQKVPKLPWPCSGVPAPLNPNIQHTPTQNCATAELAFANRSVTLEKPPHIPLFRLPQKVPKLPWPCSGMLAPLNPNIQHTPTHKYTTTALACTDPLPVMHF
jgi:hypothetical protein